MAPHSTTLAWKIPWMEEPGRLQSMGSRRVEHDWATSLSMATHSSVLAWRIPGTAEPSGLPSMGSHRVGHDWSDLAAVITLSVFWAFCWFINVSIRPQFSSVQFSRSVVSDSLRPHESQHARPLCPSPTPGVHSNSCPSSRWCHLTISFSVIPFSSCPQIPPSIRVFSNESTLHMRWAKCWFQLQHKA